MTPVEHKHCKFGMVAIAPIASNGAAGFTAVFAA